MTCTVKLFVHPKAALRVGKTHFGVQLVVVSDEDLQDTTTELRAELADVVMTDDIVGKRDGDLQAQEPTVGELIRLLVHRVNLQIQAAEDAQAAQERERAEALRQQEEDTQKRREDEAKAAKRMLSIQKWVAKNGTDSQKKRLAEGLLPESEIIEDITEYLCEELTIEDKEKYTRISAEDACFCACSDRVEFDVRPATALNEEQYGLLLETREEAGTAVALVHRAKCPGCDCPMVERRSIQVEMQWEGIDVIREYVI